MNIRVYLLALALGVAPLQAFAQVDENAAAEVISKTGDGDWRESVNEGWSPAQVNQQLLAGTHIRTGSRSKMGLLFRDQSQMRLNQNSLLIVRDVLDESGNSTRFRLDEGRAWIKSKNIPDRLIMETPSAVAAIRGTDWEIEVNGAGRTILTVLHGQVELANALGSVIVNPNQQGVADIGGAPFILQITNPKNRIQWVTQYQLRPLAYFLEDPSQLPAPLIAIINSLENGAIEQATVAAAALDLTDDRNRMVLAVSQLLSGQVAQAELQLSGIESPTAHGLLADIYSYAGEIEATIDFLNRSSFLQSHPELTSLLARAHLVNDEAETAKALIAAGLIDFPESIELLLTKGEIAIFDGDAALATRVFEEVLQIDADNDLAWYGLGRIYSEREFVAQALESLTTAIDINPRGAGYIGEKAVVETFANQYRAAEASFDQSLSQQAADAVALTGKGVLRLKQGKLDDAIQQFLKAGLLEPKLARVQVFLAIAYYQQGNADLALETLDLAKEIDDKDPLPYFLESTIRKERFQPRNAMLASKNAIERLPNLKSLNQVVNDQRGNTNLGSSLSNYGLYDWALKYAVDSYNPFWSGSSLFLSDQVNNSDYVSLSEKIKGFMNNPLAFGAPNRYSSLALKPGNYIALSNVYSTLEGGNFDTVTKSPSIVLNGMNSKVFPVSYFYSDNSFSQETKVNDAPSGTSFGTELKPTIRTYGIGAAPTNNLKLFYFTDTQKWSANQETNSQNTAATQFAITTTNDQSQTALGVQYSFSPESQLSASHTVFTAKRDSRARNSFLSEFNEPPSLSIISTESNSQTFLDDSLEVLQVKYERQIGTNYLSAGALRVKTTNRVNSTTETANSSEFYFENLLISEFETNSATGVRTAATLDETKVYLHYIHSFSERLKAEIDMTRSAFKVVGSTTFDDFITGSEMVTPQDDFEFSDNYLSLGLNYSIDDHNYIRLAFQDYLHFNLANTLNHTTTAGIPLSTEFLLTGSIQKRTRLQWENTRFEDSYLAVYFDQFELDNDFFASKGVTLPTVTSGLAQIDQLTGRVERIFSDDYQSNSFKPFSVNRGEMNIVGFDFNRVVTDRIGLHINFRHTDSLVKKGENQGSEFLDVPIEKIRLGLTYAAPFNGKVGLQFDYLTFATNKSETAFTFATEGLYTKLSWVQELFQRRLILYGQVIYDETVRDGNQAFSIGTELRF